MLLTKHPSGKTPLLLTNEARPPLSGMDETDIFSSDLIAQVAKRRTKPKVAGSIPTISNGGCQSK
jgi:hypothetical protein